ncbi:MAG: ABC transporter permease [Chloroflexi bacterium]|nr:ABC transporter permease [Chloroflexota bacterium]
MAQSSLAAPPAPAAVAASRRTAAPNPSRGFWSSASLRFRRDRVSLIALVGLVLIVAVSAAAPLIAHFLLHTDPAQFMRTPAGRIATLQPPGPTYPLGTDDVGRDVLTRLLYAGQVSLSVGFLVATVSLGIGAPMGLLAAYFGGWVDDLINAVVQFMLNIPALFVLIVLSIFLTPNVIELALIFGLFFWPATARQVRAVALSARNRDYVDAARVLGAGDARVMVRHILPNVASVAIVVAGLDMAAAILAESSLSFLGFGVPVPLSSWGNMLSTSQEQFRSAPWLVYPPGFMIFVTVLCVFLVSDGLRDALDPKL